MRFVGFVGFIVLIISFLFQSCEKKPNASFKTDKEEYIAGQDVILINTSESGGSFEWILPGRRTSANKSSDFVIDINSGFDELSFTLVAKSKQHCKRNSVTKTIKVIPKSYITVTIVSPYAYGTFYSANINSSSTSSNYIIDMIYTTSPESGYTLRFYFMPGTSLPSGTYTLQNSSSSLAPFQACAWDFGIYFVSGQLQVDYVNSKLHITFKDITDSTGNYKLTGEIYKP